MPRMLSYAVEVYLALYSEDIVHHWIAFSVQVYSLLYNT